MSATANAMQQLEWEECFVTPRPDPELTEAFRRAGGLAPPGLEYMTSCGWLGRAFLNYNPNNGILLHTNLDFSERVWLAVSQDNSCRFCYAAHRSFLQILGYSDAKIRKMEQEIFSADLSERERLVLQFARRISRSSPPLSPEDHRQMVKSGFESSEVDELAVLTTNIIFANRVATLLALPPRPVEDYPNRWTIKLVRPLFAWLLKRKRSHGSACTLEPHEREGPYSYVVRGLDGLPAARALRNVIDDAWASEAIPARTRLLIFAVVARGLGCPSSEREATGLLSDLDFDEQRLEPVLAHLDSPDLDEDERAILSFARETIRFQAQEIQQKARALREQIGNERFVEVVSFCALANMLCRLGVVDKTGTAA